MFLNDDEQAKSFIITGSGDDKKIFDKKLSFCYYIIIMRHHIRHQAMCK